MYILHDPDETEAVITSRPCSCGGTPGSPSCKRPGGCNGSVGYSLRRRAPDEIKRIKAERRRKEEDAMLAQAEAIRTRRGLPIEKGRWG